MKIMSWWRRARRNRRTEERRRVETAGTRWASLGWAAVLALVAAVGALAGIHYGLEAVRSTPRLRVSAVEVLGHSRASVREVLAYAGVQVGDPILDVDLDRVALAVRRHPWVKTAQVRRALPDHIVIRVSEHEPALLVALGELYVAADDGAVFKRSTLADGLALPVVTGIARDSVDGSDHAAERVRAALSLAKAFAKDGAGLGRLEELHWDADLGWSVVVRRTHSGALLDVRLGTSPETRIALAATALKALDFGGLAPKIIWADGRTHAGRVHVALDTNSNSTAVQTLIAKAR